MLPIKIVPQKREFGCAKAVIKTVIKTKYGMEVPIKDPLLYIQSLGTLSFLGIANDALRENKLPGHFIKKTNVKFEELKQWVAEGKLMIILLISRENYPHYVVLADIQEDEVIIANTHGAVFEKFSTTKFIERWYLNTRYIEQIEWMKGQSNPFMDRIVRWGIKLGKTFGFVQPGSVYILEDRTLL